MFPGSEGSRDAGCSNLRLRGHGSCHLSLSWDAENRQDQDEKKNFHVFWGDDPIWESLAELWLSLQHSGGVVVGAAADLSLVGGADVQHLA